MWVQVCIIFVFTVQQCALHWYKYVAGSWENPKLMHPTDWRAQTSMQNKIQRFSKEKKNLPFSRHNSTNHYFRILFLAFTPTAFAFLTWLCMHLVFMLPSFKLSKYNESYFHYCERKLFSQNVKPFCTKGQSDSKRGIKTRIKSFHV